MFNIVYPLQTVISGSDYNTAVKDYVKMVNNINLTRLVIQNENLYRQSYINYLNKNGKKIAKINSIPLNPQYPLSYYIKEPLEPPPFRPLTPIIPRPLIGAPFGISPYMAF